MPDDPIKKQPKSIAAVSKSIATVPNADREEEIRRRAYELYQARGCEDGHDLADWLFAEAELASDKEEEPVVAA